MIEILWLNERMLHCAELAQWIHAQFPYEFREQALGNWQAELASGQLDGSWQSLIAVEGEHLLGSASLARDDLPSRPELSPWLACVYVRPECRGQGLAERLIEAICARARDLGHDRLYLHTHDRADYYARRGWQALEDFQAYGKSHRLMELALARPGAPRNG